MDLQDLAGLRVVVATADEVEVLATFLKDAESRDKLKIVSDRPIASADGYRSRHFVLEVGSSITHSIYDVKVEVQLHTIMEHAFNFISRAWVYKSDRAYPQAWQREFRSVSKVLHKLDDRIAKLHAEVLDSSIRGS